LKTWDNMKIPKPYSLRWPEPFRRDMNEIHRSGDTGLCNRLFHWEIGQELNKHNDYRYKIFLEESRWPELKELIDLPNTRVSPELEDEDDSIKYKRLVLNSTKIDEEYIKELYSTDLKLQDYSYHSDFGHTSMENLYGEDWYQQGRPIQSIKLKDRELEELIKEFAKDKVGIHIRRGRGIKYDDESVNTLPESIREKYIEFRKLEGHLTYKFYIYEFITDQKYFDFIESILKRKPNQKFYISHDMPDELVEYYYERYPDSIYTKTHFYDYIKDKFKNTNESHVKNVVDLFTLANTKMVLKHPLSTWSEFSHRYTDKLGFYFHDDMEYVLNNFNPII